MRKIVSASIALGTAMINPLLHRQIYEYFRCLVVNGKEELIEDRKGFKVLKALEKEFPNLLERESTLVTTAIMAPYVEIGSPLNYHNRLLSNSKKILVARGECHDSEINENSNSQLQPDLAWAAGQRKRKLQERSIHVTEGPSIVVSPPATTYDDTPVTLIDSGAPTVPLCEGKTKDVEANNCNGVVLDPAKRLRVDPALVQAVLRELEMPCEDSPSSVAEGSPMEQQHNFDVIGVPHWDATFQLLVEFNNRYGHVHVPQYWTENEYLGDWVHQQREHYRLGLEDKPNPLTQERIERLQSLSFSWTPKSEVWNQRFGELLEYRQRFDHTNVPQQWSENKQVRKEYENL